MVLQLSGSAFITGAGGGIGQSVVLAFARYGVSKLALVDVNPDHLEDTRKLLNSQYPHVETTLLPVDVSDEPSVQNAIENVAKEFKRIDYAVNCAGIGGHHAPTHEMPLREWQRVIEVNQTGVWLCQKYLVLQMLEQESRGVREGRGVIVNVSSMYGRVAPPAAAGIAPYTAAKHAVMGLTKTDARLYAPMGIRINAICPGYVDTPLIQGRIESGVMEEEFRRTPAGRPAMTEEISDAIVFLSSPMASFMHGVGLAVDGGYTL
ncbi:short chain dehydrogenase/reductase family oxidoreductase [Penicillium riverlandense]|uniref:short chain dehydrogenase/reductase family oxidoreductase n=1 Tax=Penicillium riverlandense TaxID=1903569 RepID=UPI002548C10A|nr:short chain dehydrogenase/reductase family oxidoreductase [Penicillium riverlandense]KAJ5812347.1 short chain dehydrogenase/reductase family oxidoreductase [Penicillium riverlandense]